MLSVAVAFRLSVSRSGSTSSGSTWSAYKCSSMSVLPPRRRVLSGSSDTIWTRLPNSWRRPGTKATVSPSVSWRARSPYSLCMSNTSDTARPVAIVPASSRRVRKLFPVPVLPNTAFERSTNRARSRHTGASIPMGVPT